MTEDKGNSEELVPRTAETWGGIIAPPQVSGSLMQAILPKDFTEAWKLAHLYAKLGNSIPKDCRNNPAEVFARFEKGASCGLSPIQSLDAIMNVNGHYSIYGDHAVGVCQSHPLWGGMKEWITGEAYTEEWTFYCEVTRKGEDPHTEFFSWADAVKAGYDKKDGPWTKTPQRMMRWRPRSWSLRAKFSDALAGLAIREEAVDMEPIHVGATPDTLPLADGTHTISNKRPDPEPAPEVIDAKAEEPGKDPAEAPAPVDAVTPETYLADAKTVEELEERVLDPFVAASTDKKGIRAVYEKAKAALISVTSSKPAKGSGKSKPSREPKKSKGLGELADKVGERGSKGASGKQGTLV